MPSMWHVMSMKKLNFSVKTICKLMQMVTFLGLSFQLLDDLK